MTMPIFDVFSDRKRTEVIEETWGHMRGQKGNVYTGYFLFAVSAFSGDGDVVIDFEFEDLDSSPWFYEQINSFVFEYADACEDVGVYRFDGTYCVDRDNPFEGKVVQLDLRTAKQKG